MKKILFLLLVFIGGNTAQGQSHEAQQLLLNVEKLAQFKQILADLKKGYAIVAKGYTVIKDISEGNFNLHEQFLDALLEVSPVVKRAKKIGTIVQLQGQLVKNTRNGWQRFTAGDLFTTRELDHIHRVYERVIQASLRSLDDLLLVITARKLRMTDQERLTAIEQVFQKVQDQLQFVRQYNTSTSVLAVQRLREQQEVQTSRRLYGIQD